jgi:methenyltetrahydrofolate cyclohydrolase
MAEPAGTPPSDLLSLPAGRFIDAVAARTAAPGAGAVSSLVAALASALTAMCARYADQEQAGIPELIDRANELRALAAPLGDADVKAYSDYLVSSSQPGEEAQRAAQVALDEATRVPLTIGEIASEIAELAAHLAHSGNRRLRGDATAAVQLAAGAAAAAAVLVAENVADLPGDPRLARAADLAAQARAVADASLKPYPSLRHG